MPLPLPALIRTLFPGLDSRLDPRLVGAAETTLQIVLIIAVALLLRAILRLLIRRLHRRYALPPEIDIGVRRTSSVLISVAALLAILYSLGVTPGVLWAAFTGFAAVGAVAFFAAWSVLSNIFCTFLIVTTRPFRLHDHIELLENGDKPGLKGKVVDINLIYTTLQEADESSVLQIPNSLFFQRTTRRQRNASGPYAG
ncbi:MAG TPA: mechanosensitive ion channel family protein [Stenotrophomonas sp.]|nr:mechanosensitive ion channel family protein [Stenotrophomonas sp.]